MGVMFAEHQMFILRGDDFYFEVIGVKDWHLSKLFSYSYLYESGRFFGNLLGFFSIRYLSLTQWQIIDSFVYVLLAVEIYLLALKTNSDISYRYKIFVAIGVFSLIVFFPYKLNNNVAGYIMTASNYTYPICALLFSLLCFYKWCENKFTKTEICLTILACAYCSNQELLAVILIALTAGLLIYKTVDYNKKACICFAVCFLASFTVFTVTLLCPAHLIRLIGEYNIPINIDPMLFSGFSTFEKLYKGYTSSVAVYLFQVREPLIFICALLCVITSIANKQKTYNTVIACIPLILLVTTHTMAHFGIHYLAFPYTYFKGYGGLANLVAYKINPVAHASITIAATIAMFSFIYTVCLNFWNEKNKLILILIVVLVGVVSRELQSFTVLLYRIGERGLYLPLFAVIITNAILITNLKITSRKWQICVLALIYILYFITSTNSKYYFL